MKKKWKIRTITFKKNYEFIVVVLLSRVSKCYKVVAISLEDSVLLSIMSSDDFWKKNAIYIITSQYMFIYIRNLCFKQRLSVVCACIFFCILAKKKILHFAHMIFIYTKVYKKGFIYILFHLVQIHWIKLVSTEHACLYLSFYKFQQKNKKYFSGL